LNAVRERTDLNVIEVHTMTAVIAHEVAEMSVVVKSELLHGIVKVVVIGLQLDDNRINPYC